MNKLKQNRQLLHAFFWVIPRRLNFVCRRFGTLCLFNLHRQMASMWFVTLHSLFLYSDPPLPCHPNSYWLRLFSSQTFSRINTPAILKSSHTSYLPAYEDGTECSETSAYKIQTPGNYPEESIQHNTCMCHHGIAAIAKDYDKPNVSEILLKCASHYLGEATLNNSLRNLEVY